MTKRIRIRRRDRDGATYSITLRGRRLISLWERLAPGDFFPLVDPLRGELLYVTKRRSSVHDAELFARIDDEWPCDRDELKDGLAADYDFEQLVAAAEAQLARARAPIPTITTHWKD